MINKLLIFFSTIGAVLLFIAGKQSEKNKQIKKAIKSIKNAKKAQHYVDTLSYDDKRKLMLKKYSRTGEFKS